MNELKKFSDIEVKYENSPFRILHITLHCIDIHDNSQIKYIKYVSVYYPPCVMPYQIYNLYGTQFISLSYILYRYMF